MPDPATYRPAPGSIPVELAVYRFRDPHGWVIYVGKAKSLRNRLTSYIADVASLPPRTRLMVTTALRMVDRVYKQLDRVPVWETTPFGKVHANYDAEIQLVRRDDDGSLVEAEQPGSRAEQPAKSVSASGASSRRSWPVLNVLTFCSAAVLGRIFERQLGGHPANGVLDHGGAPWLNFPTVTNQRWHHDNIVLMGDSAHTTHYSIGSGTILALEDATGLADKLCEHEDLESALDTYEKERKRAIVPLQGWARYSAQWYENLPRYIDLQAPEFTALLRERRSPILPHFRPLVYYRLYRIMQGSAGLQKLRERSGPTLVRASQRRPPARWQQTVRARGSRGAAKRTCPIAPQVVRFDDAAVGVVRDDNAIPDVVGHDVMRYLRVDCVLQPDPVTAVVADRVPLEPQVLHWPAGRRIARR